MGDSIFTYKGSFPYTDFSDENGDIAYEEQDGLLKGAKRIASAIGQWTQTSEVLSDDEASRIVTLMESAIEAANDNNVYLIDDCFDETCDILDGADFDKEVKGYIAGALGVWMSYVPFP